MNPMIKALAAKLGRSAMGAGAGLSGLSMTDFGAGSLPQTAPTGQSWGDLLRPAGPTPNSHVADAFGALPAQPQQKPVDRINAAFEALQQNAGRGYPVASNAPGVFDSSATMMPGPVSNGGVDIPDRPGSSPRVTAPPVVAQGGGDPSSIGFFLRNALAQRDRESGQYLNPEVGAQAMNTPFKGLFG
jgi:hypothetical protein